MDYNTRREKLIMPEYGRHIQKMVEYVVDIPDKEKRNEQIKTIISVMGVLNPQLRDIEDFRHKLWDHVHIISDFNIEIDSPYPIPTKETFSAKPNPVPMKRAPLKSATYGRNIQNMIEMVSLKDEGELKDSMILVLANYMRQQYVIWNKDSVSEETIYEDIYRLSDGRIKVPEHLHLAPLPANNGNSRSNSYNNTHNNSNRKRSKNNKNRRK